MEKKEEIKLTFVRFKFLSVLYENNFNNSYTHQSNWLEKDLGKSTVHKLLRTYDKYIDKEKEGKYRLKDEYFKYIGKSLEDSGFEDKKNHPRINIIFKNMKGITPIILIFIILFGAFVFLIGSIDLEFKDASQLKIDCMDIGCYEGRKGLQEDYNESWYYKGKLVKEIFVDMNESVACSDINLSENEIGLIIYHDEESNELVKDYLDC